MSKRNHIVERASDVNGGQYIQTNPSYNSGYEDGKKAGKEYCASEIESLREQVEKLTKERDDLRSRRCGVCGYLEHEREHTGCLREQLAALAEQNEKMREALQKLACLGNGEQYGNSIGNCIAQEALSLPDLTSPVLNRIRAEENEAIIAAANALENIASTSSSTRIRRVANDALTAIRARRK